LEVPFVGVVLALSLAVLVVRHLDEILDINVTCWSLRRWGVDDAEIKKVAIASAKRGRRLVVVVVLDRIVDLIRSRK
jgi:hypothetical protein